MAEQANNSDWPGGRPKLTHMGINVIDIDKMVGFYTRVLGLTVSDRGFSERLQCKLAFMTSDPNTHHQVVMLDTRSEGGEGNINQISFTVSSLDELRQAEKRLAAEDIEVNPINHGNAWSIYFPDPEGNTIEIYLDAPYYAPQPRGDRLDLSLSDDEIARATEELLAGVEGFTSREEWSAGLAKKMG